MHAPLNHHHPRTIHACTIEPSNPRSRQPTLARQGKKQWRMTSNSIQMPTTLISMARAVLSRTTTRMSVATKTLRPGSSHTSNSSPKHLGSPTMCLVVFTCSFKFAMCVYTVCMHSKVRTHGHDTQTFAYGYITYKPCVFGVNTLSWPWTFTMCWEGTEKKNWRPSGVDHQEPGGQPRLFSSWKLSAGTKRVANRSMRAVQSSRTIWFVSRISIIHGRVNVNANTSEDKNKKSQWDEHIILTLYTYNMLSK